MTLGTIAEKGAAGFYSGWVAEVIAAEMRGGGLITEADLKAYRVVQREPVRGTYRGYEIISMPPPSSGGTHLIEMLDILEGHDLKPLGHNSAAYVHRTAEAMRRAYADRAKHMGDPDFYPVPVAMLRSKSYAAQLRKRIDLTRAAKSADIHAGQPQREGRQTTHFSVMDDKGDAVANTYTLNFAFGSGFSEPTQRRVRPSAGTWSAWPKWSRAPTPGNCIISMAIHHGAPAPCLIRWPGKRVFSWAGNPTLPAKKGSRQRCAAVDGSGCSHGRIWRQSSVFRRQHPLRDDRNRVLSPRNGRGNNADRVH